MTFSSAGSVDSDGSLVSYWFNFGDNQYTGWQPNASVSHSFANAGSYNVRLWVKDNCDKLSAADQATITISGSATNPCQGNQAPIANAGADQSGQTNQSISFSASASSDAGGAISSYSWNFGDGQTGSGVSVSHSYASIGQKTVTLTVTDNCGASASDTAIITISNSSNPCATNTPPTPNLGPDRSGVVGTAISFSAAASSDAQNNMNQYWFNFGDGAFTGWQSQSSATHAYSAQGNYSARLWCKDSCGAMSVADIAVITVSANNGNNSCNGNTAPIANAGPDQAGILNQSVFFNASASSDSGGSIVSYSWNFGDSTGASGATPNSFHIYTSTGQKTVTLTVTDNCGATATDQMIVNVQPSAPCANNQAPIANAGPDKTTPALIPVLFNGSASSDADGQVISYRWFFGNGQSTNWQPSPSTTHSYTAGGNFTASLQVKDNCQIVSAADNLIVTVINQAPVNVSAGLDRTISLPANQVSLSGSAQDDGLPNPPGAISYFWSKLSSIPANANVIFSNPNAVASNATFSIAGSYILRLTVSDGALSASDDVAITVLAGPSIGNNRPPLVDAGADQSKTQLNVLAPLSFTLSGTASDDGLPNPPGALSVTWSLMDGPGSVTIANPNSLTTNVSLLAHGVYHFLLEASDGQMKSFDIVALRKVYKNPQSPGLASFCANNNTPAAPTFVSMMGNALKQLLGDPIYVQGTASDGLNTLITPFLELGDGTTSLSFNAQPLYEEPGVYQNTLRVADECGVESVTTKSISVIPPSFESRRINEIKTHLGKTAYGLAHSPDGQRAYVMSLLLGLVELDVSDPANPQILRNSQGIFKDQMWFSWAFLWGNKIEVNENWIAFFSPQEHTHSFIRREHFGEETEQRYLQEGKVYGLAFHGNYAFAMMQDESIEGLGRMPALWVYFLPPSGAPTRVARLDLSGIGRPRSGVTISAAGDRLFYFSDRVHPIYAEVLGTYLQAIEIANPLAPTAGASIELFEPPAEQGLNCYGPGGLAINDANTKAYVGWGKPNNCGNQPNPTSQLDIVDISNPNQFTLRATKQFPLPNMKIIQSLRSSQNEDFLLVAHSSVPFPNNGSGYSGAILKVSNSDVITQVFSFPQDVNLHAASVNGTNAILTHWGEGISVWDFSNLQQVQEVGAIPGDQKAEARAIAKMGNHVLVDTGSTTNIYDVSDPVRPELISQIPFGAYGIEVKDHFAYLGTGPNGLKVYNISNPSNPVNVFSTPSYPGGNTHPTYAMAISADKQKLIAIDPTWTAYAYPLAGGINGGLRVWNLSNPSVPQLTAVTGTCEFCDPPDPYSKVAISENNVVYTSNYLHTIVKWNLTGANSQPTGAGHMSEYERIVKSLETKENLLFVGIEYGPTNAESYPHALYPDPVHSGLKILNGASNLSELAFLRSDAYGRLNQVASMAVSGDHLIMGGEQRVFFLDISNPSDPTIESAVYVPGKSTSMLVDGNRVYLGEYSQTLNVVEFDAE